MSDRATEGSVERSGDGAMLRWQREEVLVTLTTLEADDPAIDEIVALVNGSESLSFTNNRLDAGAAELVHYLRADALACLAVRVRDLRGENVPCGLLAIGHTHRVDHFVLSRRFGGLGIEQALFRFAVSRFPSLEVEGGLREQLTGPSGSVRVEERQVAVGPLHDESLDERPRILLVQGRAGAALAPFLGAQYRVEATSLELTAGVMTRGWGRRSWQGDTRLHLGRLFRGEYSELHLGTALEALLVPLYVPVMGIHCVPFWIVRRYLNEFADAEQWVRDALEAGRPILGSRLPRLGRGGAAAAVWALSVMSRSSGLMVADTLLDDLERLRRRVPVHTQIVLTMHPENGYYYSGALEAFNPIAHERIVLANRLCERAARRMPNLSIFDSTPVLGDARIFGRVGHYTMRTYSELAAAMVARAGEP